MKRRTYAYRFELTTPPAGRLVKLPCPACAQPVDHVLRLDEAGRDVGQPIPLRPHLHERGSDAMPTG